MLRCRRSVVFSAKTDAKGAVLAAVASRPFERIAQPPGRFGGIGRALEGSGYLTWNRLVCRLCRWPGFFLACLALRYFARYPKPFRTRANTSILGNHCCVYRITFGAATQGLTPADSNERGTKEIQQQARHIKPRATSLKTYQQCTFRAVWVKPEGSNEPLSHTKKSRTAWPPQRIVCIYTINSTGRGWLMANTVGQLPAPQQRPSPQRQVLLRGTKPNRIASSMS